MPSSSERDPRLYLEDMLQFCDRVIAYTQGIEQTALVADGMRYDATLRNLELMGETATHVPEHLRGKAARIPWRQIVATRNRLVHAYLGIDQDTVWSIISEDVPALRGELVKLLAAL